MGYFSLLVVIAYIQCQRMLVADKSLLSHVGMK